MGLGARWNSPSNGDFLSRDSFPGVTAQPGSLNPYAYVLDNPVLQADPSAS